MRNVLVLMTTLMGLMMMGSGMMMQNLIKLFNNPIMKRRKNPQMLQILDHLQGGQELQVAVYLELQIIGLAPVI